VGLGGAIKYESRHDSLRGGKKTCALTATKNFFVVCWKKFWVNAGYFPARLEFVFFVNGFIFLYRVILIWSIGLPVSSAGDDAIFIWVVPIG
jgi:hypothetical protein